MASVFSPGSTAALKLTPVSAYTWNEALLIYKLIHDTNNV